MQLSQTEKHANSTKHPGGQDMLKICWENLPRVATQAAAVARKMEGDKLVHLSLQREPGCAHHVLFLSVASE